jgi:nucleotide-binding universal stress UspA family protein
MVPRPQRIVVGYDGSEASRRALDRAASLAGYGTTLTVVSVASHGPDTDGDPLDDARRHFLAKLVDATYVRAVGDPAEELVSTAQSLDADVVVVGRRSGNLLRRLVLGSVSAKVVRAAPCDVLVVH